MCFVNKVKKKVLSKESQDYIKQYQLIYKRALKKAKKKGGGGSISKRQKTKQKQSGS